MVAGVVLGFAATWTARRWVKWPAAMLAGVVATMAAEAMVELVEYPLVFRSTATAVVYYDTIADIGLTLVGALIGSTAGLVRWRRPR